MVCIYTLLSCFPRKMECAMVFLLCDLGVGRQTAKGGVRRWWCIGTSSFVPGFLRTFSKRLHEVLPASL